MLRSTALAVIAIALNGSTSKAAPIVIDNFASPSPFQSYTDNPVVLGPTLISPALSRTINSPLGFGDMLRVGANIPFATGTTNALAVFTGDSSVTTSVLYAYAAPMNLNGTGAMLNFQFLDSGVGTQFNVEVLVSTTTGLLTGSLSLTDNALPTTYTIPYSSFTGTGDLGSVNSISLRLNNNGNPQAGVDFILTQFAIAEAVPEPATLATFGLMGLFGGYAARRKLKAGAVV